MKGHVCTETNKYSVCQSVSLDEGIFNCENNPDEWGPCLNESAFNYYSKYLAK